MMMTYHYDHQSTETDHIVD